MPYHDLTYQVLNQAISQVVAVVPAARSLMLCENIKMATLDLRKDKNLALVVQQYARSLEL